MSGGARLPTVSALICVYNGARYLREAIESALAQTYPSMETVVVNDGSTDETDAICKSYQGRIRYLVQENRGLPAARNRGIRESSGDHLAILDSDDVWRPDKIDLQMRLLSQDPGLGLVYSNYFQIDPAGQVIDRQSSESRGMKRGPVLPDLYDRNFIGNTTVVIPRRVLDHIDLFSEELPYSLDWDLWLRIAFHYPVDFIDEPLASWRWRPNYAEDHHEPMLLDAYKIISTRHAALLPKLTAPQISGHRNRLARISFSLGQLYRRAGEISKAAGWIRTSIDHDVFTPQQRQVADELESVRR